MMRYIIFALLLTSGVATFTYIDSINKSHESRYKDGVFELVESIEFEEICVGRYSVSLPANWPNRKVFFAYNGITVSRVGSGNVADAERLFLARRDELAAGTVKDGYSTVQLRWNEADGLAFSLAHSLEQPPGFPEMPKTIEGWTSKDGILFNIQGIATAPYDNPERVRDLLRRLHPQSETTSSKGKSCFEGGYISGPLLGTETVSLEMNSDTSAESHLSLSLDLISKDDGQANFDKTRFGDLTREYPIAGVPGGERVAIFTNELQRDSGIELLASAGGSINGVGLELRAEIAKQNSFPETPPFGPEETLTIWHTMLKSISLRD